MMAEQQNTETSNKRQFRHWPWLVGAAALLLYLLTVNRWVTFSSLATVATVAGWDWHPLHLDWRPGTFAPLHFVATYPFRWLPGAWQPLALNLFSAACAALTLALLVRSVRLLPHDRTRHQRKRESGEFALLSIKSRWIPPVLAALALGFQLTFWEHATAATGEMLNVLVFAWVIRCLLEYRISQEDKWLGRFTFAYGLGVANNWALIGFFPFFLIALVWIKGLGFFNWRFLARLLLWGLCGLSLYLLIPLIALATGQGEFWSLLRAHLAEQKLWLLAIPRYVPLLLSLPTLMALFFIGIRWPSLEGDVNAFGKLLSSLMLQAMHLVFLGFGLWFFFDCKFSPRVLMPQIPFLTFYYMAALSVGYFSGYVLLVFRNSSRSRRRRSGAASLLNWGVAILVWAAVLAVPAALTYRNLPKIHAANGKALREFAERASEALGDTRAVVLSDNPENLYLLNAIQQASGKAGSHILIDTSCLPHAEYLRYLAARYPELRKLVPDSPLKPVQDERHMIGTLLQLSKQLPLYYIHPSFGYYFEFFSVKPHGLVYQLLPAREGVLSAPPLSAQEIKFNQDFWNGLKPEHLLSLRSASQESVDAATAAGLYSTSLNYWGVELQRLNRLKEANEQFARAVRLSTNNVIALVNQQFNEQLQQGDARTIASREAQAIASQPYRVPTYLKAFGPVDEPGLLLLFGEVFAQGNNLRQACALFYRQLQLQPGNLEAQFDLAKTYVDMDQMDKAFDLMRAIATRPITPEMRIQLARTESLAWLKKKDYGKAEQTLLAVRKERPKDPDRVAALSDFYRMAGYMALQTNGVDAARKQFTNAILCIDDQLKLMQQQPQRPGNEGARNLDALQKKADLQIRIASYDQAAATLGQILQQQPNNADALVNRAVAQVLSKKYDGARQDYIAASKILPGPSPAVYYGLGEIAFAQNDKAAAIKNYKLYLKYASREAPEYKDIAERLRKLEAGS